MSSSLQTHHVTEPDELPEEAKIITCSFLQKVLWYSEKRDVIVDDFHVFPAIKKGNSFANVILRLHVFTKEGGEKRDHHLIIKILSKDPFMADWSLRKTNMMLKEVNTYSHLLPAMMKYQRDHKVAPLITGEPRYYFGELTDNSGLIITQDLRHRGYRLADQSHGIDYEHCQLVMKELARFHASSYALKMSHKEAFVEHFDYVFARGLFDESLKEDVLPMLKNAIQTTIGLVGSSRHVNKSMIRHRLERLLVGDIFTLMQNAVKPRQPFSVICHGDLWCSNMVFKYSATNCDIPQAVKFLDYHSIRYALPTTDLTHFFYTSTSQAMREAHLNDLLKLYHVEFTNSLLALGHKIIEFTFDKLLDLFKESSLLGIVTACYALPAIISHPVRYKDYGTEEKTQRAIMIHDRLIGSIEDGIELGVL